MVPAYVPLMAAKGSWSTQETITRLHPGDIFPSLTITPADGQPLEQSTGFRTHPEGRVVVSVYSSGAIGRLVPDDVIGLVKYVREHQAREQAA